MPDNYAYINARIRAMHARLVTEKLEETMQAASYGEFLRILSESNLGADLGEATAAGAGLPQLDAALSRNFFNTAQKVVGMADGESGRDIALLFARYDLLNLKAVVRGKIGGRGAADIIPSLLPAGSLKPSVLEGLANVPELNGLVGVAGLAATPLASAFRKAVSKLAGDNDLLAFEVALDQAYYTTALSQASSGVLKDYLRREVDGTNILTALKLKAQGRTENLEGYFIAGGREVSKSRFDQIANGSGGLEGLRAYSGLSDSSDLSASETVVRGVLLDNANRLYASDALGIGVVIGFLKDKEREVALARLIARGKYYNVPTETLRREVGNGN
jgi:V/A-type H+/Na+-transporting ATPase subunit C